ncbi:MAG: hypothetical protein HYV35_06215 [Lentisphaerae bacterium]|nr:hypothetical protein [Lentisphaerota bacterium]
MAKSEKLLSTCRSALPFRARTCWCAVLPSGKAVMVRAWRSAGGTLRHVVEPQSESVGKSGLWVGCLPVQESLTLWLNSSLTSLAKARKVLPTLLDIQLPFPLEECLYQFVEFRRTAEGTVSALVCAARREAVQACLARYQAQDLDPMLLDHEGLALWTQSLVEAPAESGRPRALICLEDDHVTLALGIGDRFGQAHSFQAVLAAGSAGDLVNRLQLLLHAGLPARNATHSVVGGPAVSGASVQWLYCGARAGETAMVNALHQSLEQSWPGPLTIVKEPALFLARALCERALKRGPLRCNLRQPPLVHPAVQRAVALRARAAVASVMVAGLLLIGFSVTARLLAEQRLNRVKAEIDLVAAELAPGAVIPYGREVAEVQKAWEKRAPLTKPFLEAFAPSLAARLAEVVRSGQAAAVRFETLSLRRNSLVLTGLAEDWDQCGELEERLKALGYSVKLERQEAVAETAVRFTVNAQGGGP